MEPSLSKQKGSRALSVKHRACLRAGCAAFRGRIGPCLSCAVIYNIMSRCVSCCEPKLGWPSQV